MMNALLTMVGAYTTATIIEEATAVPAGMDTGWLQTYTHAMVGNTGLYHAAVCSIDLHSCYVGNTHSQTLD